MTVGSYGRTKPNSSIAELASAYVDRLAAAIGDLIDGKPGSENLISDILEEAADNVVCTDRIKIRFEPMLDRWDFQVLIHFTLFTDPQDTALGKEEMKRITRSQLVYDQPKIKFKCAELLCDVIFSCRTAVRRLAEAMFYSDAHNDFENACFYAAREDWPAE